MPYLPSQRKLSVLQGLVIEQRSYFFILSSLYLGCTDRRKNSAGFGKIRKEKGLTPFLACGILRPLKQSTNFSCWFILNEGRVLPCTYILVFCCGRIFDVVECLAPGRIALTGRRALPLCPDPGRRRDNFIFFRSNSQFSPGSFVKSPRFFVACNAVGTPGITPE